MVDEDVHYEEGAQRKGPADPQDLPAAKPAERAPPGGDERERGPGVVRENAGRDATAHEEGA
jgi:hypothetical protein